MILATQLLHRGQAAEELFFLLGVTMLIADANKRWVVVHQDTDDPVVKRYPVPGGWLYQVSIESVRQVYDRQEMNPENLTSEWMARYLMWHPAIFVPDDRQGESLELRISRLELRGRVCCSVDNRRIMELLADFAKSPLNDGSLAMETSTISNATGIDAEKLVVALLELEQAAFVESTPRANWRITTDGLWEIRGLDA